MMLFNKKNEKKINKGFTLIEILTVIVVLSLILSIVIFSVNNVINRSRETIDRVDRSIILEAAKNYAVEYRNSDNWVEEKMDNGQVNFCVSLDSLIEYGYFKNKNSNFKKYKDQYVVKASVVNGVYSYDFVKMADLPEGDLCRYYKMNSNIIDNNSGEIVEEITNSVNIEDDENDIGKFNYVVSKIQDNNYSIDLDMYLDLVSMLEGIYVTFILDSSTSMINNTDAATPAKNAIISTSEKLVNDSKVDAKVALIQYSAGAKLVREFKDEPIKSEDFLANVGGTNISDGLNLATSFVCNNGLAEEGADWCKRIKGADNQKKNINSYVIVLFDGYTGVYTEMNSDEYDENLYSSVVDSDDSMKEYYYGNFLNVFKNNNLTLALQDVVEIDTVDTVNEIKYVDHTNVAEWKSFMSDVVKDSGNHLKETGSTVMSIVYDTGYISGVGDTYKSLSSMNNKLCSDSDYVSGDNYYCHYESDVDKISGLFNRLIDNIIKYNSSIESFKLLLEPKQIDNNDVITIYKDDVLVENNFIEIMNSDLSNISEDVKVIENYQFKLNSVLMDNCETYNDNNQCVMNNVELFDVYIDLNYSDKTERKVIDSPAFNLVLDKIQTIN